MTDTDTDGEVGGDAAAGGWFAGRFSGDSGESGVARAARERIAAGGAPAPRDWPALAVETGFADDEADYYDRLHAATTAATRETVRERERADDAQLVHAVRAMNDMTRIIVSVLHKAA